MHAIPVIREKHTKFWSKNLQGRDHSEDLGIDGILEKYGRKVWTGCIWLRIRTSGGLS
jgi:hypothetical protein